MPYRDSNSSRANAYYGGNSRRIPRYFVLNLLRSDFSRQSVSSVDAVVTIISFEILYCWADLAEVLLSLSEVKFDRLICCFAALTMCLEGSMR